MAESDKKSNIAAPELESIEFYNPTNPYDINFTSQFWFALISYNTATNYQSDEIEEQIKQDLKTALRVANEKRTAKIQAQINRQRMILEEMRKFFNLLPEEKND